MVDWTGAGEGLYTVDLRTIQADLEQYSDCLNVVEGPRLVVTQPGVLRGLAIERLVRQAVFGAGRARAAARWAIWEAAGALDIFPDTLAPLLHSCGQDAAPLPMTIPALNLRTLTFDMACAVFAAAHSRDAGAVIFELARCEIAYTAQEPGEYVAAVLGAAIRTGHQGPVFFQGDHFQVHLEPYAADPEAELASLEALIRTAIQAGFYNIDVGASGLVDYGREALAEQFARNCAITARLVEHVRARQPDGAPVAVGAQVSPPWGRHSQPADVRAFMDGLTAALPAGVTGPDKISVYAGTRLGGLVQPDGSLAEAAVDFGLLHQLAEILRGEYGLPGIVQYGASTLPTAMLHRFGDAQVCEIHLATGFQNTLFEHPAFPAGLRREIYAHLDQYFGDHRPEGVSDAQFYYRERKRALGHFKRDLWTLDADIRAHFRMAWEQQIGAVFDQLNIANSAEDIQALRCLGVEHRAPAAFGVEGRA